MLLSVDELLKDAIPASEWANLFTNEQFTPKKYLESIFEVLDEDKFNLLLAITREDIKLGLLTATEIATLKSILRNSFEQDLSMRQIIKEI